MPQLLKHWRRITLTLIPLGLALLHAAGAWRIDTLQRLDNAIYDIRLRATMPRTLDERIVIVDIDEKSLAEVGRWPWGRNKLAELTDELFTRQQIAMAGFDVFFPEPDESSGLKQLQHLARGRLRDQPGFQAEVAQLQHTLDYDALFARSLQQRPIALSYYFTSDREGRVSGVLPEPVMTAQQLQGRAVPFYSYNGYGANIEILARAAPVAGHANPVSDSDGVIRSVPLVAEYGDKYYEALSLSMFRLGLHLPKVGPGFPHGGVGQPAYPRLESLVLTQGGQALRIPVNSPVAALVPFRGPGGANAGSFRYISASELLDKRLPASTLKDKIVLIGTTAPGLQDLRVTPVGQAYPGVEMHANLLSGLLDDRTLVRPDYVQGVEVAQLLLTGLLLAVALPLLSAARAIILSAFVIAGLVGTNLWAYLSGGLVLPLAAALLLTITAFGLNMSYGYFVESRSKRELANLFGTYVPPELVDEMLKDPDAYSMQAVLRELTVMFCDMRGFTELSETMEPTRLQALLNDVFSRLTQCIRNNRGTIDKYMGDCVMGFWGAPVDDPQNAVRAVRAALEMTDAVRQFNRDQMEQGIPPIGIGIGLNTGNMCVGDMGSSTRRSYTVVGDAVNLGSRLEGLSKIYGVAIVASESTRLLATEFVWQELDRVRVKGKQQAVTIFTPRCPVSEQSPALAEELKIWNNALRAYRAQDWDQCDVHLLNLQRLGNDRPLYHLYVNRVSFHRSTLPDPQWDGATHFDTK